MPKVESGQPIKSQVDKFREAARELKTDDSEEHFDATLKKIAKASPTNRDSDTNSKK